MVHRRAVAVLVAAVSLGALLVLPDGGQAWPTSARCPVDVSVVIDISTSMVPGRIEAAKAGSIYYVDRLSAADDQSGVVSFGTGAYRTPPRGKDLDFDHVMSRNIIAGLAATEGTDLTIGIRTSHQQMLDGMRPDTRAIIVFLTDGFGGNDAATRAEATAAKANGIEIFTIGVGTGVNVGLLQDMASDPDATYFKLAPGLTDVQIAYESILMETLDCRPVPDFSHNHDCAGHPITFRDLSVPKLDIANMSNATWDWDDGNSTFVSPWHDWVNHTFADPGTYDVNLTVFDDLGRFRSIEYEVEVDACPQPDFECLPLVDPYLRVRFQDLSSDLDGDLTTWRYDLGPPGIRNAGGLFTADYPAKGWYNVTLQVWDAHGHTNNVTKPCYADLNLPPVIDPHPTYYVYEDEVLEFFVTGRDVDSDTWFFSWDAGPTLPAGARFDAATQKFTWKPIRGMSGMYNDTRFAISDYEYGDETFVNIVVLPVPMDPPPAQLDADGDGVPDRHDNCPNVANEDQAAAACGRQDPEALGEPDPDAGTNGADGAGEGSGDGTDTGDGGSLPDAASAPDVDLDGVADDRDNCPEVANPLQADADRDRDGDACDLDVDGDGLDQTDAVGRRLDNCPFAFNPDQRDSLGDGVGDACRGDADADQVPDADDPCPLVAEADCTQQDVAPGPETDPEDADPAGAADVRGGSGRIWPWLLLVAAVLAVGGVATAGVLHRRGKDDPLGST